MNAEMSCVPMPLRFFRVWSAGVALGRIEPRQLSRLMASMLVAYVRYFQRRYRFAGHVFQGRFKSPAIEAEPYLLSCGRYIERNPVAANLVQDAWQYRWSSCRAYALGVNDSLLAPNPWYEQWSPEPTRRQVVNLRHRGSHESGEMGQRWWPHSRPSVMSRRSLAAGSVSGSTNISRPLRSNRSWERF